MNQFDQDKRKSERVGSNLFVDLSSATGENKARGVVVDASISGIAIETEADLESGDVIDCDIEVPLRFRIRIMRKLAPGQMKRYGGKFVGQGIIDKILLKKILLGSRYTRKV